MIKIFIDNEELDLPENQIVTIKKSQNLNGVQNQYSFSNNFNLPPTSKNQRLLKINYLPNSKAKSMTQGYDCDAIINGCIFLKKQKLKVQKQSDKEIPIYIVFTDSLFVAKSKEVLINDINLESTYDKSVLQFLRLNTSINLIRTAPISAQSESNIVVVEELPPLVNLVKLIEKIVSGLGYSFYGDFFTNLKLKEYYLSPNFSIYGVGGAPKFNNKLNCFQFLTSILKTFNAYIDPSDSDKSIGIFLWNQIDNLKKNFVDYSEYFEKYNDYYFEGGLSKINTIEYSGSQPFFNSFFENNKSIVEKSSYLKSDFGAGSLRLFSDQELSDTLTLPLRVVGEVSQTTEINIFKFEETLTTNICYVNGTRFSSQIHKAYSPNILEIFNYFHLDYTKNISLPTVANLQFRYDALFLSNLKMQNVFFIKNLSTYWLPLELNYSTKKDKINVKCLMIEKTAVDIPVVYDLNISFGFLEKYKIIDASPLYSTQNTSAQSIFTIVSFDQAKNKIFITGSNGIRTQVLATPINIDILTSFILEFENIDTINQINNSDLLFSFTSQEGGVSRIAKINIQHNGFAKYISEFRMLQPSTIFYNNNFGGTNKKYYNLSQKITTVLNIDQTLNPQVNAIGNLSESNSFLIYKMLKINKKGLLNIEFNINAIYKFIKYGTSINGNQGGSVKFNIKYCLYKNTQRYTTVYNNIINLVNSGYQELDVNHTNNVLFEFNDNAVIGDEYSIILSVESIVSQSELVSYNLTFTKLDYTFYLKEQL